MKTPVKQFETILLATFELAKSMEKANISTLKLLQEVLKSNPSPTGIEGLLRMAEKVRRAWSILSRQGKASTRKARDPVEEQELVARAKKNKLTVSNESRKKRPRHH